MTTIGTQMHKYRKKVGPSQYILYRNNMFWNIFKRKSKLDKLKEQHTVLRNKAFKASTVNRTLSDELTVQANAVEQKILDMIANKRD